MTVLLVWLHLLAAISWIGGTIFLSVALVPVLKREPFASQKALLFRTIAMRFRAVVWGRSPCSYSRAPCCCISGGFRSRIHRDGRWSW